MSLLLQAAETHHELAPLLMPPVAFGLVAAAIFTFLGFVTFSFRDVANRHSQKWGKGDEHGHGH